MTWTPKKLKRFPIQENYPDRRVGMAIYLLPKLQICHLKLRFRKCRILHGVKTTCDGGLDGHACALHIMPVGLLCVLSWGRLGLTRAPPF